MASGDANDDAAAAKKREANRKKRERLKAKKQAEKTAEAAELATPLGRWQKGKLPGGRAERREAGPDRGMGVFALEAVPKGDVVASAPPALSCIFDAAADTVCSFCFDQPGSRAVTEREVTLTTSEPDENNNRSFGLKLDDHVPPGATVPVTLVTMVLHTSPNRDAVRVGDRLLSVNGQAVTAGQESAVPLLIEAAKSGGEAKCVFARPALICCPGCKRTSCCEKCVGKGRLKWHANECVLCRAMPEKVMKGETATLRMLLRYKVSTDARIGEWSAATPLGTAADKEAAAATASPPEKEPISLLTSLQANACDVPPEQLQLLSKLSDVSVASVAALIYQVRTNACQITRGGRKVGSALSVLMGWHNHDCEPNAASEIGADGCVTIRALRELAEGEEITISYVDRSLGYEERRKTLETHYGFECRCNRCVAEQRQELKARMKERDNYLAAQRR